jgi:hypothetical protein
MATSRSIDTLTTPHCAPGLRQLDADTTIWTLFRCNDANQIVEPKPAATSLGILVSRGCISAVEM